MGNPPLLALRPVLQIATAVLAAVALVTSLTRVSASRVTRWALGLGSVMLAASLLGVYVQFARRPLGDLPAASLTLVCAGVAMAAARCPRRACSAIAAILLLGGSGLLTVLREPLATRLVDLGAWQLLAEWALGAAAVPLLWAGAGPGTTACREERESFRSAGVVLAVLALIMQGVAAQRAWGTWWSWDPMACLWFTAVALITILSSLQIGTRSGFLDRLLHLAVGLYSVAVLLGAPALLRALGLSSLYLR